jgi:hypothetical protein
MQVFENSFELNPQLPVQIRATASSLATSRPRGRGGELPVSPDSFTVAQAVHSTHYCFMGQYAVRIGSIEHRCSVHAGGYYARL